MLGACAAIVGAAGCNGSQPLIASGTGGSGRATGGAGGATGGAGGAGGQAGGAAGGGGTAGTNVTGPFGNNVDILMMIDNSSSMTEMQEKLYLQLPLFIQSLQSLPTPPSLHLAVVSSDMGAPGDSAASIGCTAVGDQGEFQSSPRSDPSLSPPVTCTNSTITPVLGAEDSAHTFITDADMMPNFTDPSLSDVLQCIALLGDKGCGFEHQLASIDRALGADGLGPVPSTNVGFLRPDAYLVIVMLTNEDDCSAPANTELYSLNGDMQNIANPLGPIANYRCNQWGHLCTDPGTGQVEMPPLNPPSDVMMTGETPTLDMTNCTSNDTASGLLTPVTKFVSDIKSLKPDPDKQIIVASIAAPATPYTVAWLPEEAGQNTKPGELWPEIEHSCGLKGGADTNPEATQNPTDQSFGDPAVRIAQFVQAFPNEVQGSICDASFATTLAAVASKIGQLIA
ncbi:MAG TPA: hypothetical protein VLC06_02020, partial [Polyangia bacterium]|nr:hypothetical protein [Polyangia bacterium]